MNTISNVIVADKALCEELYILTNYGKNLETAFYYDRTGRVWAREHVRHLTTRTLPPSFHAAYQLGELRHLAITELKNLERRKSQLKTALYKGENDTCHFVLQMKRLNQLKA